MVYQLLAVGGLVGSCDPVQDMLDSGQATTIAVHVYNSFPVTSYLRRDMQALSQRRSSVRPGHVINALQTSSRRVSKFRRPSIGHHENGDKYQQLILLSLSGTIQARFYFEFPVALESLVGAYTPLLTGCNRTIYLCTRRRHFRTQAANTNSRV